MSVPPAFLMTWMGSRLVRPLRHMTASTAILAKWGLSTMRILEERVVRAMLVRSSRSFSVSDALSNLRSSSTSSDTSHAVRKPWMMVMGCSFWLMSCSASRSSSPASTATDVVPSPTSSS